MLSNSSKEITRSQNHKIELIRNLIKSIFSKRNYREITHNRIVKQVATRMLQGYHITKIEHLVHARITK